MTGAQRGRERNKDREKEKREREKEREKEDRRHRPREGGHNGRLRPGALEAREDSLIIPHTYSTKHELLRNIIIPIFIYSLFFFFFFSALIALASYRRLTDFLLYLTAPRSPFVSSSEVLRFPWGVILRPRETCLCFIPSCLFTLSRYFFR